MPRTCPPMDPHRRPGGGAADAPRQLGGTPDKTGVGNAVAAEATSHYHHLGFAVALSLGD